jgi:hypothetical protein
MQKATSTVSGTNRRSSLSQKNSFLSALCLLALVLLAVALAEKASAQTQDPLLNTLIKKGILTEEEAKTIKTESEASMTNAPAPSASKWKIGEGLKNIEIYGDMRLRFEDRMAVTPVDDYVRLDRLRYSLRFGLRGELYDDFNYGFRLDTSSNPRSAWVTFGSSTSGTPFQGPFGKSTGSLDVGQIYLGWKAAKWFEITLGKMANPLYTTPMVWDPDLNPEGAAERFKYTVGQADFFANFGQFLYQDVNPTHTAPFLFPNIPLGQSKSLPFLLAWQGGLTYHIDKDLSFKAAATLYNYTGHGQNTAPGGSPAVPGFSDSFVGEGAGVPVNGASGFPGGPNNGFAFNQTGINDLLILNVPFEVNFKIAGLNARVFGDYAQNLAGSDRANAAVTAAQTNTPSVVIPLHKDDTKAYQFGLALGNGTDLGAAKKGNWEARAYWQHSEQYSLDPNLIDSDFFEGRLNMQGVYVGFTYFLTDALYGSARYGYGKRINNDLGTGGANQDIPQVNPIKQYSIFQFDVGVKF